MKTLKHIGLFIIFALVFQFVTQITFNSIAAGQEITPALTGNSILFTGDTDTNGDLQVRYNSFLDLPADYGKRLSDELYYHWAKAHNARERATVKSRDVPVVQYTRESTASSLFNGSGRTKVRVQNITRPPANRAITLYNPYFRIPE